MATPKIPSPPPRTLVRFPVPWCKCPGQDDAATVEQVLFHCTSKRCAVCDLLAEPTGQNIVCVCGRQAGDLLVLVVWTAIENTVFFGTRVLLYTSYSRFHRPPFYFPIAASNMCSLMSA